MKAPVGRNSSSVFPLKEGSWKNILRKKVTNVGKSRDQVDTSLLISQMAAGWTGNGFTAPNSLSTALSSPDVTAATKV